jgi:PPOX class probable FMN-dependent enzyme
MDEIRDAAALRAQYGPVSELAARKVLDRLDRHCRAFIALSPFLVLASSDGADGADASPRGDAPGFVRVLDDTTLLLPDRPGNRRMDSYANVLERPGVGLLFLVPGIEETLRVNGVARVVTEAGLLASVAAQGAVPQAALLIAVHEAFFHCGKALIRSHLWDASRQVERRSFPTLGRILADQTAGLDAAAAEAAVAEGYRTRLY